MKLMICGLFWVALTQASVEPETAVLEIREISLQNSPSLKETQARFEGSRASRYTALTRWFPHLDFQLMDSWSRDYSTLTSGALGSLSSSIQPQDVNLKRWSLNATLPLYRRSIHLGFQKSDRESALLEARWLAARQEWDVRFADLLGQCLLRRFEVRVMERAIEAAEQALNEAKIRFQLGQTTRIEFLRAEVHLLSLRKNREQSKFAEADQKKRLVEYTGVGLPEFERLGLLEDERDEESVSGLINHLYSDPRSYEADLMPLIHEKQLLSDWSMKESAVYRQFELEEGVQLSDAGLLMANEWPDLSLQGSYGRQDTEWDRLFNPDQRSRTFSIVLTIPVFSGGSLLSSAKEKRSAQEVAFLQRSQKREKFLNDNAQDIDRARVLKNQSESDRLEEERFEEILRLSRKGYQLGKTTQREVLESERDWLDSRLRRARNTVEYGVVLKRLAYHLGVIQ